MMMIMMNLQYTRFFYKTVPGPKQFLKKICVLCIGVSAFL